MRTTLKRGIGRGETNGRAGPLLSPLTPVSRYGSRRSPLRIVGKILFWTLIVLFVAAGALAGGVVLFVNQSIKAVRAHSPEVIAAERFLEVPIPGKPTVAIVIGFDKRAGVDKSQEARSDTVMLIRADPKLETVSLLSFPRDLIVDIPGCRGHPPFRGRINEAFTYCSAQGTLQTVKQLTGVPINYMVTVNFRGFREIVDRLGGVYVDIDQRYLNDNSGFAPGQTYATIDLHAGYQRLTGRQALDFVRFRHTDSDIYRAARQQQFVKALKQQVSSSFSITQVPGIVNTVTDNVEVGTGGSKAIDFETLYGYAKLAHALPAGNFQQFQIQGLSGYAELSAPEGAIDSAVEKFLNPDPRAGEKAASAALGAKPKADAGPRPAEVTIEILNGNGVAGSADDAAYLLGRRGYQVVNSGNADAFDYFETEIVYDPAKAGAEAAAEELAELFGETDVSPAPAGTTVETMVRIVVGQTFHGRLAPGTRDETPEHAPPAVAPDTEALAQVRRAAPRLDFPVLVPGLREQTSALSTSEPARAYRIGDHQAFRLVYRTGAGEYWGIEQTDWTDAPILDGPSVTRTIKGREYLLFFDGPRLHMVAFEENDTVYWVVNTLLDRLSNETMLAVAKGLRPARGA